MVDTVIHVVECGRCALPAVDHNVRTGLTTHLDHRKQPCRTAARHEQHHPRPDLEQEVPE